ncbi:MAG: hypothetical protein WA659_04780 [Candidatus Aquirickettsiella sp.]
MLNNNYDFFLKKFLAFESGIDPAYYALYLENYSKPIIIYPEVVLPGRVIRNFRTGEFNFKLMTYNEYFSAIGVNKYFKLKNLSCIPAMQYNSMNMLGFIGYQIGESILISTDYYKPKQVNSYIDGREFIVDSYYYGAVPNLVWANGCTETLYQLPGTTKIILATDINKWEGTFTGKDGLNNLSDLFRPEVQEKVIRGLMNYNYRYLVNLLNQKSYPLEKILNSSSFTLSGILAATHLVGSEAVANYLTLGTLAQDEFGTSLLKYLTDFSKYSISYSSELF